MYLLKACCAYTNIKIRNIFLWFPRIRLFSLSLELKQSPADCLVLAGASCSAFLLNFSTLAHDEFFSPPVAPEGQHGGQRRGQADEERQDQ